MSLVVGSLWLVVGGHTDNRLLTTDHATDY